MIDLKDKKISELLNIYPLVDMTLEPYNTCQIMSQVFFNNNT